MTMECVVGPCNLAARDVTELAPEASLGPEAQMQAKQSNAAVPLPTAA